MTTYVSLLRGINLGPARQVSMPDLQRCYADLGLDSVVTYIRSGNVVFGSDDEAESLRGRIEEAIERDFGMEVGVVLRTHAEMADIVARNPFPHADAAHIAVSLLSDGVPANLADLVGDVLAGDDEYVGDGREVYLHLPNGFGRSKLAARISGVRLPMVATVRNWRTVNKLVDLSA